MKFEVQKYLEISTIHGLVYITKRYHIIEKIFWIISIIISVIYTTILIVELITKLWNFPIVTYISDQSIHVSEINLPAVTVCPRIIYFDRKWDWSSRYRHEKHTVKKIVFEYEESKGEFADQERFGNITYLEFLDRIENGSIDPGKLGVTILKTLQVLDMIADRGIFSKLNFSIPADDFLNNINEFQKEFAYHPSSLYILLVRQVQEYISEIITPWGLCFTYNIIFSHDLLNTNETSEDFHYEYVNKMFGLFDIAALPTDLPYKLSTSKAGLWMGIFNPVAPLTRYLEYDFDGYMVFFHSPYELPSKNSKVLKFNKLLQTMIWIDPTIIKTDESLMEYEPAERNCYLEDEKVLKFFKVYTKNNCENECLSSFMLSRCGCVEFFMIRNATSRICSANERNCYKQAEEDFEEHKDSCECFEPCEYVSYGFEVITAGFSDTQPSVYKENVGFLLQYKSNEIQEQVRKKQFTILDILSFVGGLLGLFMGFSALSFVELVYWFTVRVWMANYKRTGTKVSPVNEDQGSNSRLMEAKAYFLSYFAESSIHGLGHISEFSWIISMIWTTLILTTMSLCLHLVLSARDSVPDSRVIAYDDSFKSIDNIPFPAITIVPIFSYLKSYVNVFATMSPEASRKFAVPADYPEEDFRRFIAQRFFCHEKYNAYGSGFNFSFVPYVYDSVFSNSQLYWFVQQSTAFNGKYQPKYAEIRTSRGLGYSFNMMDDYEILNFKHISSDFNYTRYVTTEPKNLRNFSSSQKYPLNFKKSDRVEFTAVITKPQENYDSCIKQSIMVHEPNYLPTFSVRKDFMTFDYGTNLDVIVTPEITRTDDNLRKLSPEERGCYFEGEKKLHYFNSYSQRNCELECITNATFKKCGCVHIDQPYLEDENVCADIFSVFHHTNGSCLFTIQNDIYLSEDQSMNEACACLPLCNSIRYNIEYHTTYDTYEEAVYSYSRWQRGGNEATINIRMNMDDIILYRRYQQFTFSDVVSYVGGLLGLFAGISMLSIVEFFYFFTIRLGVNLWRGLKAIN